MRNGGIEEQIISKERVSKHGEVLTSKREVEAMLNLVQHETQRIESRFLEPACGNGNFLVPVLQRKLELVRIRYGKSQSDFERYAVLAVSSVYGIDILDDNVKECRGRLYEVFNQCYTGLFKKKAKENCRLGVQFVLERNIIRGDALSLTTLDENPLPIVFSEWSLVRGGMVKRPEFVFQELVDKRNPVEASLQSDLGHDAFIPTALREYPLKHVLELFNDYES